MTIWRYWVRKKIVPKRAKKASAIAPLAAEKRRLRNSRTSSIGVRAAQLPGDEAGEQRRGEREAGEDEPGSSSRGPAPR